MTAYRMRDASGGKAGRWEDSAPTSGRTTETELDGIPRGRRTLPLWHCRVVSGSRDEDQKPSTVDAEKNRATHSHLFTGSVRKDVEAESRVSAPIPPEGSQPPAPGTQSVCSG